MTRIETLARTALMSRFASRTLGLLALASALCAAPALADDVPPAAERYNQADVAETPDFQRHVVPLMGKLGCNGRACHGSFQGQGDFRLSLFGYDFKMDHEQLTQADKKKDKEARVDLEFPEDSLMLLKPTLEMPHKGGKRMEVGSWQHRLFVKWIEAGAKPVKKDAAAFVRLEVTPSEIVFRSDKDQTQLKAVAVWSDGTREDVTCLSRFQTNDDVIADITDEGLVSAGERGDTHVVVFYDTGVVPIPVLRPVSDFVGKKYPQVAGYNRVDELVQEKLAKLGLIRSEAADDAEFLRRVSLDITGSLPAPQEVSAFLSDTSSDKRSRKIDELLERPSYAAWWTTRLCDMTGNNDYELRNAVPNRTASESWYDWIYKRVAENTPYDKLAEGIILATSMKEDETYAEYNEAMHAIYGKGGEASYADRPSMPFYWARVNFRTDEERAIGFAYSFMGIRIECAQCHKHPFDQWTQDDFNQFKAFFDRGRINYGPNPRHRDEVRAMVEKFELGDKRGNQLRNELRKLEAKGEIIPYEELYVIPGQAGARRGRGRGPATAKLLGGDVVELQEVDDPREPLMDWLRNSESQMFARAFVNRVWSNYFNRGIVEPTDDLSLANPPSNAALLEYLTDGFVRNGYDMKWLHREIANSRTYQTSWVPNETNSLDHRNFSRAIPRRLPAEVAYDAIAQATASDEVILQMQQDVSDRATAVAGSSPRYNNRGNGYALTVFGRSIRESNCDCDRSSEPSLLQTVFLQNDDEVYEMLDRGDGWLDELFGIGKSRQADAQDRRERAVLAQRAAAFRARIKKAREEGDKETVERLERRVAEFRAERDREDAAAKAQPAERTDLSPEEIVRQAYLRTVSRYPTDEELNRAADFVASAENQVEGVRGLLWALINTKEFIVNH